MESRLAWVFSAGLLGVGCVWRGTHPHNMSLAGHRAPAIAESQAATQGTLAQQAHPGPAWDEGCYRPWTGFGEPSEKHLDEDRAYQGLSGKRPAVSRALHAAETRSCGGIPNRDRNITPFVHAEEIVSVELLPVDIGRNVVSGRRIVFRALSDITAEGLQRLIDCHVARNAALGYQHGDHNPLCPLAVKTVAANVTAHPMGWSIDLIPDSEAAARELRRRTESLRALLRGRPCEAPRSSARSGEVYPFPCRSLRGRCRQPGHTAEAADASIR